MVCHEFFKRFRAQMSEMSLKCSRIRHPNMPRDDDEYNPDAPTFDTALDDGYG